MTTPAATELYKLRILSLGAGVQSTAIFLMSIKGLLPKPHLAIFADTGWETMKTYQHLEWLEQMGKEHGTPIVRVEGTKNGMNLRESAIDSYGFVKMPTHSVGCNGKSIGRRECTYDFKIQPIKRKLRELLGLHKGQRAPQGAVEQWIGISMDELRRTKTYRPDRMSNMRFPLIEWIQMNRQQCIQWIDRNFPNHVPPKSSCIGCPYHTDHDWRLLTLEEFSDACLVDDAIRRDTRQKRKAYLHFSCIPLADVDFTDNQMRLFDVEDEKNSLILTGLSEI